MNTKPCPYCLVQDAPDVERRKDPQILSTLMNYSRDIILFVRFQDGRILEANAAAERAYGYTRAELLGMSLYDIRAPEALATIDQQLAQARRHSLLFETLHRHKDGTVFPVEVNSKEAIISGQSVLVSIVRDISERKKSDAALLQSRERFRSAIDSMPDVVLIYDRDLRIQYINPATVRKTGRPPSDFIGRRGEEVWPAQVGLWRPALEKTFASGEVQTVELDFPSSTGLRHLVVTCVPLRDAHGSVQEVMSITHDLTARKKAEEALQKGERRLQAALEETEKQRRLLDAVISYAPVGIAILKGRQHRFLTINTAFEPIVAGKGDVIGRSFAEAFPEGAGRIVPLLDRVFRKGQPHYTSDQPFSMDRKGGGLQEAFFTFIYAPWYDRKGRIAGVMLLAHDTTERKRGEDRLRKSLLEKEVLLQEIHHRVKNNMQVINSLMNLQAAKIKDEKLLAYFREATSRVHVMSLIHDSLYRSENLSEIDLQPYVRQLVQSVMRMYTVPGVKVEIAAQHIHLDMDQAIPCGLIINELVTNTLKYAFAGRRTGRLAIEAFSDQERHVTLIVSDDGVGLPPQIDPCRTQTLGLKLVHGLVDQLGGTIELPRAAQGTRIVIRFPVKAAETSQPG